MITGACDDGHLREPIVAANIHWLADVGPPSARACHRVEHADHPRLDRGIESPVGPDPRFFSRSRSVRTLLYVLESTTGSLGNETCRLCMDPSLGQWVLVAARHVPVLRHERPCIAQGSLDDRHRQ